MKEEKLSILNESGERLVGIKTIPSIEKKVYPAVILAHGFGVTKEESGMFTELAKQLSNAGFLVYRFDFSGCGESEGDYSETSLSKLSSDLSRILEFVKSQPQVDTSRVGILGQSFGTAAIVTLEPEAKCLVLMGSVSHPKEILSRLFGKGYNPDGISTRVKSNGAITRIKPQFWQDLQNRSLLDSIRKIHCPILFIHGGRDDIVPLSEMEAYFDAANEPKRKIIIEGATHGLRPHRDKMYKVVVEWFKRHLSI